MQDESVKASELNRIYISDLKPESKSVNVCFFVREIKQTRHVKAKFSGQLHEIVEARIADESGEIILTLWNNDIDEIVSGKYYYLERGYISLHNYSMRLSKGHHGVIEEVECNFDISSDLKDMSRPFAWKPAKKRKQRSGTGKTFTGKRGRESKGYCSYKTF